jgi:hypothetical protein
MLGDMVAAIERHYAPYVKELGDRARRITVTGEGIEKTDYTRIAQSKTPTTEIRSGE